MTHSSPVPVSQELENHFKSALQGENIRFFQAQIKDEQIVEIHSQKATSSVEDDFNAMSEVAGQSDASYFLFRFNSPREWLLLTYVPDGVQVKNKMMMASAKGTLKDKLGYAFFVEEAHATKKEELSYAHYQSTHANLDSRSAEELMREEVHKLEEVERKEQQQKPRPKTVGYHAVVIPLSDEAIDAIERFKSGSVNFIQFVVSEDKTSVNAVSPKTVNSSSVSNEIHSSEPRFYLYNVPGKSAVFIFCCPERSPPKLRMVYSTAKPAVAEQIEEQGVTLAGKKIEIREPSELADELRTDFNRSTATIIQPAPASLTGRFKGGQTGPDNGGVVKASKLPTVQNQHPIYALMSKGNTEQPTTKKKIVMPPPGAWN